MERKVITYSVDDINEESVKKVKIISQYAFKYELDDNFSADDLSFNFGKYMGQLFITLGEDWYFIYRVNSDYIKIEEWAAARCSSEKTAQSVEMYNAFEQLFINNYDKKIEASLLYDTSYPFYLQLKNKGYIKVLKEYSRNIGDNIYYDVVFEVTNKFIDRYQTVKKSR